LLFELPFELGRRVDTGHYHRNKRNHRSRVLSGRDREEQMEFYLSFHQLLGRGTNSVIVIFLPLFLIMTALEAVIILRWEGTYLWKNAGVSVLMTVGHFISQAATHA
jgi:hypothetical protein